MEYENTEFVEQTRNLNVVSGAFSLSIENNKQNQFHETESHTPGEGKRGGRRDRKR